MDDEEEVIDDPVIEEPEEVIENDDVIIVDGDEPETEEEEEHKDAPKWVKEVRTHNRELKKKVKELEGKLNTPTINIPVVKPKPKLEDFDYNSDKYDEAMIEWTKQKLKADEEAEKTKRQQQDAEREWTEKVQSYEKSKKTLRVKDFEDAEEVVKETLNPMQQGIIVNGSEIPAELVYVIGRNPKRAKELAEIKDPVKFAFAVAKLEAKVRVERKDTPAPERKIGSVAPVATSSNLDRLREEATKTGNWDKYFAAKRKAGK